MIRGPEGIVGLTWHDEGMQLRQRWCVWCVAGREVRVWIERCVADEEERGGVLDEAVVLVHGSGKMRAV